MKALCPTDDDSSIKEGVIGRKNVLDEILMRVMWSHYHHIGPQSPQSTLFGDTNLTSAVETPTFIFLDNST